MYELVIVDGAGVPKGRAATLPSVTTILKALPKHGLEWWGHKLGVTGVLDLLHEGELHDLLDPKASIEENAEKVYAAVKKRKRYTPSSALTKAGTRGTDAHDLAERLLKEGELPPKSEVPEELHGYAKALHTWWTELHARSQEVEIVACEVPVFSLEHRFAGTLDGLIRLADDEGAHFLVVDFKTSKGIYLSHLLQLTAYEYAARERGYIPDGAPAFCNVVRLDPTGTYEMQTSWHTIEDFLAVKRLFEVLELDKKGGSG